MSSYRSRYDWGWKSGLVVVCWWVVPCCVVLVSSTTHSWHHPALPMQSICRDCHSHYLFPLLTCPLDTLKLLAWSRGNFAQSCEAMHILCRWGCCWYSRNTALKSDFQMGCSWDSSQEPPWEFGSSRECPAALYLRFLSSQMILLGLQWLLLGCCILTRWQINSELAEAFLASCPWQTQMAWYSLRLHRGEVERMPASAEGCRIAFRIVNSCSMLHL